MAKNPEKITIKIKKEELNDLDEITIEIPQKQSMTEQAVEKVVGKVKEIDMPTVLNTLRALIFNRTVLAICITAPFMLLFAAAISEMFIDLLRNR